MTQSITPDRPADSEELHMSMPDVPTEDALPEGVDSGRTEELSPEEYGGLSVEDDPEGTVDPGDLAGGADDSDEDVS